MAGGNGVEVEVKSQLSKILTDLQDIQKAGSSLSVTFNLMSGEVGKSVDEQTKKVKTGLEQMQEFGRRVAGQLKKDFSALFSVGSLAGGLQLTNQLSGSVKEAITLSDTVRRLGSIFGIVGADATKFQTNLQQGLAGIGASSEAAANALKGLSETPVRGQQNLIQYAKTATQLASISGQKGQEGEIAKGAAGIITARGGNPNDLGQLSAVSEEILKIRKATGRSVTEITGALGALYTATNSKFKGALQNGGSTTLAAAAVTGGPQATSFLENFIGKSQFNRLGQEAQGFKNIVTPQGGLNAKAIEQITQEAKGRGMGDVQSGLATMGLSDEEAKGFMRLSDALKDNGTAINGAKDQVVDLNEEYRRSMGLGDSFKANINKLKGYLSPGISAASQGATDLLGKASETTGGAAVVTGGAAILAALLTGGGLRGIGKGLIGDTVKEKAMEAATGEKYTEVWVKNWPSSFGGAADLAKKAVPALLGAGELITAAYAAAAVGTGIIAGKGAEYIGTGGVESDISRLIEKMSEFFSGKKPVDVSHIAVPAEIRITEKPKRFDVAKLPARGSSQ